MGTDVHAFATGRDLVLGGVKIEHDQGLAGHSDADVLIHAVCDAVLGAAGLGDIGDLFPDTDPAFKDIDSRILLKPVRRNWPRPDTGYSTSTAPCLPRYRNWGPKNRKWPGASPKPWHCPRGV